MRVGLSVLTAESFSCPDENRPRTHQTQHWCVRLVDSVDGWTSGAGAACPVISVSARDCCEIKQEQVIIQTVAPAIWSCHLWGTAGSRRAWESDPEGQGETCLGSSVQMEVIMNPVEGGGGTI